MKRTFCISILLSMFFQSCMSWPLLTSLAGLAADKKGGDSSFFHLLLSNSDPVITRIELSYQDSSIAKGTSTTLEVTAIFDNGTNQNITDSTSIVPDSQSIVAIQGNRVRGIASGSSIIKAEYNGMYSEQKITITPATISSIQVTSLDDGILPKGTDRQFAAIGIFSDGSHQDISNDPLTAWSSSNIDLVQVDDSGLASGINLGTAHIRASFQSKQASEEITVGDAVLSSIQVTSNSPNIPLGKKQKLTAIGVYSDNSNRDISSSVIWNSSNSTIANIQNNGILQTADTGIVTVSASSNNITGSIKLIVTPAALVSISVSPTNSSIPKGLTQKFTATGIFTDNSTQNLTWLVTWISSDPSKIKIENNSGIATASALGSSNIKAIYKFVQSSPIPITVTDLKLKSITINPSSSSIAKGLTQQFKAVGTFIDGSEQEITNLVTWYSSTYNSISENIDLTVSAATLSLISISPTNTNINTTVSKQFFAVGTYSDGTKTDLTSSVTWSSSNQSQDTDTNLNFKYISMGKITGLATAGTSSIAVLDDRIHVDFAKRNQNLNASDFGKITFNTSEQNRCAIVNNCEASDGYRGNRFRIDRMPYFGRGSEDLVSSEKQKIKFRKGSLDIVPGPIVHKTKVNVKENRLNKLNNSSINWGYYVGIDFLFVFKEKFYAANGGFPNSLHNGSIIHSISANPSPCEEINRCSSWKDTAPISNPKWHNSPHNNWFSLELTKYLDLILADKAFSQFSEFNGRLYVTRMICVTKEDHSGLRQSLQTVEGCTDGSYTNRRPQLWKCDPTLSGDTKTCEAEDWSLVGDNGTGFTNFRDDSNHSMTMVVASGSYLYVGFDNENGIQIWRTNLENPGSSSHNWEPIGIGGLRDVTNRQIYSAISGMNFGVNFVYISVENKDQPIKIYRQ